MRAYADHGIFVLSSAYEGCPNVVLEAKASALSVVALAIPGMEEFVSDASGILVKDRTPESLAQAIAAASMRGPALGRAGYDEVQRSHSKAIHFEVLESLIRKL